MVTPIKGGFMKNTVKLMGIIAVVAVIGFSFTACGEQEEFDRDGVAKTITITGIPVTGAGNFLDKFGYTGLGTLGGNVPTVSLPKKITSSGTLELPLIDAESKKPFDGTGTFIVIFVINETSDTSSRELYSGKILSVSVTKANTTIPFAQFDAD
jgi:hypothetical protein